MKISRLAKFFAVSAASAVINFALTSDLLANDLIDRGAIGSETPEFVPDPAAPVVLKLKTLEAMKQQEIRGDELYLTVTELSGSNQNRYYQIPSFPSHWLSRYLKNVRDVVIWQSNQKSCTPVELRISLVEEDLFPWNPDDLLGSVELKVKCDQGQFQKEWSIPNAQITVKSEDVNKQNEAFSFTGGNAHYRAVFQMENSLKAKRK